MTDSQILTIPVPPETVAADDAKYADTPLRYEIEINEKIPGGCLVSGYYKSRVSDGEFKQDNIQCRRLVVMLLEKAAEASCPISAIRSVDTRQRRPVLQAAREEEPMTPTDPNPDLVVADAFEAARGKHYDWRDAIVYEAKEFADAARITDLPTRVRRLVGENERLRLALQQIAQFGMPQTVATGIAVRALETPDA